MFSQPALTCAPADDSPESFSPPLLFRGNRARHLAATEACHRELAATGADLSAYNSTESAADFADLRKVLGFAAWNVYGTSYGSYLAQTLMRDHPEGIRSIISIRYYRRPTPSPGIGRTHAPASTTSSRLARRDGLQRRPSASRETFTRLVNKFEAEPLTTIVSDPATAKTSKSSRRRGTGRLAAQPELRRALAPAAPDRIDGSPPAASFHRGDRQGSGGTGAAIRSGCPCPRLWAVLWCQLSRRLPFATPADLVAAVGKRFRTTRFGASEGVAAGHILIKTAATSGRSRRPEAMHQPVASSIPTLLISAASIR